MEFRKIINRGEKTDTTRVIFSYYICYNSFYGLLIAYGIKSQIHSCTIELLNLFEEFGDYYIFLSL